MLQALVIGQENALPVGKERFHPILFHKRNHLPRYLTVFRSPLVSQWCSHISLTYEYTDLIKVSHEPRRVPQVERPGGSRQAHSSSRREVDLSMGQHTFQVGSPLRNEPFWGNPEGHRRLLQRRIH